MEVFHSTSLCPLLSDTISAWLLVDFFLLRSPLAVPLIYSTLLPVQRNNKSGSVQILPEILHMLQCHTWKKTGEDGQ